MFEKRALRALTFHEIAADSSPDLYRVTCGQLETILRFVAGEYGGPGQLPAPQITFDDGHISNYHLAAPRLEQYGLRGIFFVIAGKAGRESGCMAWTELRELVSRGHHVQSHTWSHPVLTHCEETKLYDELFRSRHTLEDRLGVHVDSIAIPYGRWSQRVLRSCRTAGYRTAYTSDPWIQPGERCGVDIRGRLTMRRTIGVEQLTVLMSPSLPGFLRYRMSYGVKQAVKRTLGFHLYNALWRSLVKREPDDSAELKAGGER